MNSAEHILPVSTANLLSGCTLTLELQETTLSYAVFNESLECQAFRLIPIKPFHQGGRQQLVEVISADEVLVAPFLRTELVMHASTFTLSPEPLRTEDEIRKLLQVVKPVISDGLSYECHRLVGQDKWLAWGGDKLETEFFSQRFRNIHLRHAGEVLIGALQPGLSGNTFYASLSSQSFEVIAFRGRELRLYNIFHFRSAEDFLYFTALAYEQIHFDTNTDDLVLLGDVAWNSRIVEITRRYVRNVKLSERPEGLRFSERFSNIQPQRHYALFAAALRSNVPA